MNVIIVDDDKLVSMALKTILEAEEQVHVVAVGNHGKEAIELYDQWLPDILLMDIRMEEMNGLEAAKIIIDKYPQAKILFLTTFFDDEYIIKSFSIGVKGYLLKQDFEGIVPALKAVFQGQTVFGEQIIGKIPSLMKRGEEFCYKEQGITLKESQLIELVAQGLSNKEISEVTFLTEGTIRNYLSNILDKLSLRDRTQLAIFYYQHGGKH